MSTALLLTRYANGERDFQLADLHGFDLAGADLTGARLAHVNVAEMRAANLEGIVVDEAWVGDSIR